MSTALAALLYIFAGIAAVYLFAVVAVIISVIRFAKSH